MSGFQCECCRFLSLGYICFYTFLCVSEGCVGEDISSTFIIKLVVGFRLVEG